MSKYAPEINQETGEIIFPPIKQDTDEVFVHNFMQTMDEVNVENANKPLILLSIGTNDPEELELDRAPFTDFYYSHTLLKQLVENPTLVPTNLVSQRTNATYGNTSLIHLTNPRSSNERYLYEHNIQISSLLSKLYTTSPLDV